MAKKRSVVVETAMRNRNIVIIIAVVFMIIGVVALKKMPRNEFPEFTIRQGVIVGVYPGATTPEVEAQLTRVVENYIFSYSEVRKDKTYSMSREGIMYIFVELNDNVKNADQFWSKLKHGLDELKPSLPTGVLALIANSDFGDTSALLITLSSDTKSYKDLEEELKKLEAECRKIPSTSKIRHYGLQKEKIFVSVKPELLNEYNIKSISLLGSYATNGMVNYAGRLKDGQNNLSVHFPATFESEKDLADQIVYSDFSGNVVRLKNIASIERRYEEPDSYIRQDGKKTILLSLEMQNGNNIVEYGKEVDKAIDKFKRTCPPDITISKISELPKYVDESITDFMKEFMIAIIAVLLVTMILLPFRVASVAGITVPIAVLITLGFLYFFGIELDTVSLAALIIVLGMIVDNSIVVIDNHIEKMDHGGSPWHAAVKSATELITPIITATLAIMIAYIPLAFMLPGTAGEFVRNLPVVICIALTVSVLVALLLVPFLNFVFIKKGLKHRKTKQRKSFLDRLQGWFDYSLEKAFNHPKVAIAAGLAAVGLAIILFKSMDQQLFPEMERNQFAVEVYLPTGASLESTAKIVDTMERVLLKDNRVTNVTSFTGCSSPRFHAVYAPNMPSSNYGQLLVNTVSNKATREIVDDYAEKYADCFPGTHIKFKILALQRFKAPVEIRISSDSIKDIKKVQGEINTILRNTKDITWIRNDWDDQQQDIRVNIDRDKANRLGYSKSFVATSLMIGLDGIPLTTIWENDYPVEVRLTQEENAPKSIKTIEDQYVTSPSSFTAMPLRSFATFSPEWNEGTIVRRNGTRTMTIMIDNNYNRVGSEIFDELRPKIEKLKLPEGTTISYGGEYEDQGEVFVPMGIALAMSVAFIFFILLFQFRKSKIAFLIMSTMILGLPGAAIGLFLMNYPFSLTAFIGITSLCGMAVRNGIILIDYARELHENRRMHVREAAIAAGKRRMRPVFLTSAAASVGVIPMILSRSSLWGPLGTVICFGLIVSMILTLYILPILYSMVYTDKAHKRNRFSVPATAAALVILLFILPVNKTSAQNLTLDSCRKLALLNNKKIKQADLEVKAAEQQRKSAFTHYFPNISGTALALKANDYLIKGELPQIPVFNNTSPYPIGATPAIPLNLLDYMNTAAVSAVVPVYFGGKIRNGNKLASLAEDVSGKQQALTTKDVLIRTEEIYWQIKSLQEKKITILNYQSFLDTLYRDVENYQKAGLVQKNDLLKVGLKQNELKTNLLKLNNGIELAKKALCQQMGISYSSSLTLITETPDIPSIPQEVAPENAVKNRIEYALLNKSVEAALLDKRMERSEYLPHLSVGALAFYADAAKIEQNNVIGVASLTIPISDWWGGSHKLKQKELELEKSRTNLEETTELLSLQVEQAKNELTESIFETEVSMQSVEQAKENLKITEDNFHAGVLGVSDLLEARAILQQAQDGLTGARCSLQVKISNYRQATGLYY